MTSLGALLTRIDVTAVVGLVLAASFLLACARPSPTGDLQAEAVALRTRTLPPRATLLTSAPATLNASGQGTAVWSLESDMDWVTYRAWIVAELHDYTCGDGDAAAPDERAGFFRYMRSRNELWTLDVRRLREGGPGRVRVEFKVLSD